MSQVYSDAYERYKSCWAKKTPKQVEREISSMRKYMAKHSRSYEWHGTNMTPPGSLADGDKLNALREILLGE